MTFQRMAVDDWRAMIDKTEAQSGTGPSRPAASAGLIEAAENVVIAFGMGWDLEGVIERLIETLPEKSVFCARTTDRSGK